MTSTSPWSPRAPGNSREMTALDVRDRKQMHLEQVTCGTLNSLISRTWDPCLPRYHRTLNTYIGRRISSYMQERKNVSCCSMPSHGHRQRAILADSESRIEN